VTSAVPWTLKNFNAWLDRWQDQENPSVDLAFTVTEWVMTRAMDPRKDAAPDPGQPDLWFAWVPQSGDGCGNAISCSYRIDPVARTVTCNIICSLPWP